VFLTNIFVFISFGCFAGISDIGLDVSHEDAFLYFASFFSNAFFNNDECFLCIKNIYGHYQVINKKNVTVKKKYVIL
jgi:hypothetical protein